MQTEGQDVELWFKPRFEITGTMVMKKPAPQPEVKELLVVGSESTASPESDVPKQKKSKKKASPPKESSVQPTSEKPKKKASPPKEESQPLVEKPKRKGSPPKEILVQSPSEKNKKKATPPIEISVQPQVEKANKSEKDGSKSSGLDKVNAKKASKKDGETLIVIHDLDFEGCGKEAKESEEKAKKEVVVDKKAKVKKPGLVADEKSKNNEGQFKCPDFKCSIICEDPQDLLVHIQDFHCLTCRMPFCTFTCYAFQDYSDHFQKVHCLAAPFPMKRGPVTTIPKPEKLIKL